MIKALLNILKSKKHKIKMHKQFQDIQKWQKEMYYLKSHQESGIH